MVVVSHAKVRNTPEDEAEERVEQGAHNGKEILEEGNDLGDDEGQGPQHGENTNPTGPADNGVVTLVASSFKNAEEDEASGDGGVENT